MFEGLVRQLILGYLRGYIKDIHKDQLKITLWNEEVLLENVELILEAFDYLQLPFALKQGRVGRLSIKIPWKKLGRDPIIITIEDVLISACQREDQEWSADAVERREFSEKKAKLAAAELAKFSRRVCEKQAGDSFVSYITAKILEGIQVSIRNVHVLYRDMLTSTEQSVFGLRFSSLTIMKQNSAGFSVGKMRCGQAHKIVEIQGLEIYSGTYQGTLDVVMADNVEDFKLSGHVESEGGNNRYMLAPVDVFMSLLVSRSGSNGNDAPQYSINLEITQLVLSLSEFQLERILILWDYLYTCKLRKNYGRYRPWDKPLSRKDQGWQVAWWHYAQQSVLSDVRRKLKKSSWKYLGQRLNCRRKYVNLYKIKLKCLREEQLINDDVLWDLEEMEKESDLEDILTYRCIAESELKEFLEKANPRGWLNWLSRGMLGAGGTDDSGQFSGVVSDEVIKDIYEVTKFKPESLPDGSFLVDDDVSFSEVKLLIHNVSATMWSRDRGCATAKFVLEKFIVECKLWQKSVLMTSSIYNARIINQGNRENIFVIRRVSLEKDVIDVEKPSVCIQVDSSSVNQEVKVLVEVIQPLEVTYEPEFVWSIMEFYHVLKSFKFHQERVMLSINGVEDVRSRLLWKAEYILSNRKRMVWDVNFMTIHVIITSRNVTSDSSMMMLQMGSFHFATVGEQGSDSDFGDEFHILENPKSSNSSSDILRDIKLQDLYEHFELKVDDLEMKVLTTYHNQAVPVVEKISASVSFTSCIICDESILVQLKVDTFMPSFHARFSPSIYLVLLGVVMNERWLHSELNSKPARNANALGIKSGATSSKTSHCIVTAKVESVSLHMDLENNRDSERSLLLNLQELDVRYSLLELQECWVSSRTMKITTYLVDSDKDHLVLCSSGNIIPAICARQQEIDIDHSNQPENCSGKSAYLHECFLLHYKESKNVNSRFRKFKIWLTDVDLHCYPHIFGLLVEFFDKILLPDASNADESSLFLRKDNESPKAAEFFGLKTFGFSNFSETGSAECTNILLENFPFITIHNAFSPSEREGVFIHSGPEWRDILKLRSSKIRSPDLIARGIRRLYVSPTKSRPTESEVVKSDNMHGTGSIVDSTLSRIRVHFHDSSCIIATISISTSKSLLSPREDCLDMLFSSEGLTLCSSCWPRNNQEFLWGPSLSNISPVLNVRVSKHKDGPLRSHCELSFSIQHVSCTLPPEFLALITGYFSLPDWYTKNDDSGMEHITDVSYVFEILDSTLFTPVEDDDSLVLKLDIPDFYGNFICDSCSSIILKDIPSECSVAASMVALRYHCLNLFGKDLSLSLLLFEKERVMTTLFGRKSEDVCEAFVAPLSADVWVRIPKGGDLPYAAASASTCVMVRVQNCQIIAKEGYTFTGFEALLKIIDQFSSVGTESNCVRTDVLQFRQLKKILKENKPVVPEESIVIVNTKWCVDLLSIRFCHSISDAISTEMVARADMKFVFSALFQDDIPQSLNVSFHSLALYSLLSSLLLAKCNPGSPNSSVLDLSISDGGENKISISFPSLDIWLHLLDWSVLFDSLKSYTELAKSSSRGGPLITSNLGPLDQTGNVNGKTVDCSSIPLSKMNYSPENMEQNGGVFILQSESLGINIYIPVWDDREAISISGDLQYQEEKTYYDSCNTENGVPRNYLLISLQSICSKMVFSDRMARIKSHVGKINGILEIGGVKSVSKTFHSLSFFRFSQVDLEAEILKNPTENMPMSASIQCEALDLWLSYQIFYFLKRMSFKFPHSESAQSTVSSADLNLKIKKISILLTDGRWSAKAPLLETIVRNFNFNSVLSGKKLVGSVAGDLQVNYNNIHKVLWEPVVEPWKFRLHITRLHGESALLNSIAETDIYLNSTEQLNLNVTEAFIEAIFRANEMVKDAWCFMDLNVDSESEGCLNSQICEHAQTGKYAPYMLQNLTYLPLAFRVYQGPPCAGDRDESILKGGTFMHPGVSHPIYINGTPDEQLLHHKRAYSSERHSDKQFNGVAHNFLIIQFEGMAIPSTPISMDLVGLSYFEVHYSKPLYEGEVGDDIDALESKKTIEFGQMGSRSGFVVPVVCDVSIQRYCKLVRLYSTVILFNGTSVPIELRFDIPFALSPMILDPVQPGQELPLPLNLAAAGRVRWRPLGQNVLWSEAHNISDILSCGNRNGLLRSFVCYPSHPNSDPFRCYISVQQLCFPPALEKSGQKSYTDGRSKKHYIHQVILSCPLVVRNYLPKTLSLTLECGGVTRTALLSEVASFFFHIDSSHDLEIAFHLHGFGPSSMKFPRAETFSGTAKLAGNKFCQSETLTFPSDFSDGPLHVSVEKTMDALSGAREICIFVSYLLYNCTAFPLIVSDSSDKETGHGCLIPSCYDFDERDLHVVEKNGLSLLSSDLETLVASSSNDSLGSSSKNHIVSSKSSGSHSAMCMMKPMWSQKRTIETDIISKTKSDKNSPNLDKIESIKFQARMYTPDPNCVTEKMVKVRSYIPDGAGEKMSNSSWSSPFFLVQPTGSTTVLVPRLSRNAAHVISVTSRTVAGQFSGKTRVVTFQPRYVISNACSKDLYYKQKGTDFILHLGIRQHSHLQWTDTSKELLVSVCFDEPGWQWSGCFLPDNLGDTQVKMRNYVTGVVSMIRVEVQNADISIHNEKIVGSLNGNSGTNLIILSDDDTGFMPYRIDNFSKERLRIYQQSCETFETMVQSYTSCPYAWDEPCCPRRLTLEVPGQRVLGSYSLDYVKESVPVHLSSTSEKPERILLVSVHSEGAIKVLSIIDSSYHVLDDANVSRFREKRKDDEKEEPSDHFNEKLSVSVSFIGISLMNSYPQELIFACMKNTRIDLLQSLDQQKFSLQIECLQIDNQLPSTPYPVMLSFNREHRSNLIGQTRSRTDNSNRKNESLVHATNTGKLCAPDFFLAAAKWRSMEDSFVSFKSISLRLADFHLQLDQEIILGLLDFYRSTWSRLDPRMYSLISDLGFTNEPTSSKKAHGYVKPDGVPFQTINGTQVCRNGRCGPLQPLVVPIGAPWQQISLLARRQKKVYIEVFDLSPIKLTLSFSSTPWMLRNAMVASGESLIHRGLVALADVEGAQIYLGTLKLTHHMASWDSIQEIIIRHYTRQLLQEMYKVFGSAGVIGNPMGFARSVSLGIKEFVSAPARNFLKSPAGIITGMAQGTSSLLSNTVYALSDAATQFSRAAHKGIVAFTFDDQAVVGLEMQQKTISAQNKGVVDEFLEGLTGLLQSPIRGAEKHGLLGVLSGVALGMTGLVARPAASILDATGKTAQSIRNRSKLNRVGPNRFRVRLPRPLSRELPLRPYSWEEAVGTTILTEADDGKLKDEVLIICKMLKQGGKLVIVSQRLILIIYCSSLVNLGKPDFQGVPADPEWVIESVIGLGSVIHADTSGVVVHIVCCNSDPLLRQNQNHRLGSGLRGRRHRNDPSNSTIPPLYQTDLEFTYQEEAENFLQVMLSAVEDGKERGWGSVYILHQSNLR